MLSAMSTSHSQQAESKMPESMDNSEHNSTTPQEHEPTDQAVLDYLKKKGLGGAYLELSKMLGKDPSEKSLRERLEEEDAVSRHQKSMLSKSTGGGYGYDRDSAWPIIQWGIPDGPKGKEGMGVDEARAYLDAFISLQLWVLSLPDEDGAQTISNPIVRAQKLIEGNKDTTLAQVMEELNQKPTNASSEASISYNLPPSAKPELMALTFALLTHTYCELLEIGLTETAHIVRDAFKPVYDPIYAEEYRDLYHCTTTEDIMRLNAHNSQHMDSLTNLKSILVQIASYQLRREELNTSSMQKSFNPQQMAAKDKKIQEYDQNIAILQQKYKELSQRASLAFEKMTDLPFLRRARAVRWQLTVSTTTYALLTSFLNTRDNSLLPMSTLLQTKCEIHVEHRDPLPFTPACVLDERHQEDNSKGALKLNQTELNWAAPAPRWAAEKKSNLPYPKYHLDETYDNETNAATDKRVIEFNRALLINGFRRLEALERKREYDALPPAKRPKEGEEATMDFADALEPSILMTTLTANISGPVLTSVPAPRESSNKGLLDISSIWEESGIGLCCAKLCPPDGQRVAVGCDDSAIRIWNVNDSNESEPSQVLLGHKNGFPVFDLSWNRDGRTLLSAGGDGSIRMWDTLVVGPFGEVATPKPSNETAPLNSSLVSTTHPTTPGAATAEPNTGESSNVKESDMEVPGLKEENAPNKSGTALAVYRGHAPSSPVWSVTFAPCGYYFASAGGDGTARLWTTDRPVPVRVFVGHSASNVNSVEWHPNCNYIVTGSDDKTARLWDIQSGRTVRLFNGCFAGVNHVKVSPCGQYVVGSDYSGTIHLWDIRNGQMVTQFRSRTNKISVSPAVVHSLSFSACGTALATGGDDCCVRVWDIRSDSLQGKPIIGEPRHAFPTNRSLIMDLKFSRRNLLMSVGKYVTPVPLASPIAE